MRRRVIGLGLGVLLALAAGRVRAENAPAAPAPADPPSEAACVQACGALIDRCASVFGPAMGDMRPFCQRAVVRRCRASGVAVCETPAGGR